MWKVRSSLACRMARDFSRRSLQMLRNCARRRKSTFPTPVKSNRTSPGSK